MGEQFSVLKIVPAAVAVILTTVVAVAVWSAVDARDRAQRVTQTSHVASAVAHMRDGLTAQIGAAYQARARDGADLQQTLAEKRALFVKSAETVRAQGAPADVVLMRRGVAAQRQLTADLRVALAGGGMAALDAAGERLKPVTEELHDAAHARHDGHTADMEMGIAIQNRTLYTTIVAFPAGFALLVLLGLAFRRAERRRRAEEVALLERVALTDSLTGIGNHRAFQETIARETAADARPALVLLDLDGLKRVNDRYGHEAGDVRLRALADAMVASTGGGGLCFRNGGDEFAVVLPSGGEWDAFEVARSISDILAKGELNPPASASAGVAVRHEGETGESLVRRADLALLEAKRTTRSVLTWSERIEPQVIETTAGDPHDTDTRLVAAGLARAVDARDAFTHTHCETVSTLCELVAREMGLDQEHAARLRLAGLLHDVGKIGVPDALLRKPHALTEEETATMRKHATLGWEIVAAAGLPQEAEWVLRHHERPDGSGYPGGLSGEDVPLEALIIGVADAFEAMTAGRPYAPRRSEEEAMAELVRCCPGQFDATVVAALGRVTGIPMPDEVCAA